MRLLYGMDPLVNNNRLLLNMAGLSSHPFAIVVGAGWPLCCDPCWRLASVLSRLGGLAIGDPTGEATGWLMTVNDCN